MNRLITKRQLKIIAGIIVLMIVVQGIRDLDYVLSLNPGSLSDLIWKIGYVQSESRPLNDNPVLYGNDKADITVEKLYITVMPSIDEKGNKQSFAEMNAITTHDNPVPVFKAYVQETPNSVLPGNNNADSITSPQPETGLSSSLKANASITLRGQSSFLSQEKSYKVEFDKNGDTWHGFRTLSLNKHSFDHSRMRNKIAFDLFELVPDFNSLRTRWVKLYIKDLSSPGQVEYRDYGMYEFIEMTNKAYLKDRGLDENGIIFKANFFEFYRYEEVIKQVDDPTYNQTSFEKYFELKAGDPSIANKKLIRMLDDVNNKNLDIDQIFNKYFNRDNYFTYLALHILLGNFDSEERNYYLYSPHDTFTWYYLPWDYDKSLAADLTLDDAGQQSNLIGIAHYWGIILHNRMFQKPDNLIALNQKIEQIYKIIYPNAINKLIDKYLPVIEEYSLNDLARYENVNIDQLLETISLMRTNIEQNRAEYYATLENPMPVYLGDVERTVEGLRFGWTESFDLQGDQISYILQVSRDPAFKDIVFEKSRITATEYYLQLDPDDYYWRVLIKDSKGNLQRPFDEYIVDKDFFVGLKKISIS